MTEIIKVKNLGDHKNFLIVEVEFGVYTTRKYRKLFNKEQQNLLAYY